MDADSVRSVWKEIKDHLERERDRVYEEIKSYRPPIPACDVQFNHLLEERAKIAQALSRLEALFTEGPGQDGVEGIDPILASSTLDEETKQRLRSSLKP
jgi:hypothetical protein